MRYQTALRGAGMWVFLAVASSSANAGDGNSLYVLQETALGAAAGNSLKIDQSGAQFSDIGGMSALEPAIQSGGGNSAELTIEGAGGQIRLLQNNNQPATAFEGNAAKVEVSGTNALASLTQLGDSNWANISITGQLSEGVVLQEGNGHWATLDVNGSHAIGEIIQNGGDNNSASLSVIANGASVSYTQTGSNLTGAYSGGVLPAGVTVYTNTTGNVSITQTNP